jgi:hypothetical protein
MSIMNTSFIGRDLLPSGKPRMEFKIAGTAKAAGELKIKAMAETAIE